MYHPDKNNRHQDETRTVLKGRGTSHTHLLLTKNEVVKLLLQNLVGVVDQELLVEVLGEHLEPENVQQPDEPVPHKG